MNVSKETYSRVKQLKQVFRPFLLLHLDFFAGARGYSLNLDHFRCNEDRRQSEVRELGRGERRVVAIRSRDESCREVESVELLQGGENALQQLSFRGQFRQKEDIKNKASRTSAPHCEACCSFENCPSGCTIHLVVMIPSL